MDDTAGWIWWVLMCAISAFNVAFCCYVFTTRHWNRKENSTSEALGNEANNVKILQQLIPTNINDLGAEETTSPLKQQRVANLCCWVFVIVAAYRSVFPRIDVPRICWFQTPLNYIVYGRIAATVAEICWATQISIVLSNFASGLVARTTYLLAIGIVPLAVIAECFSWTCLSTENQLYCTCGKFRQIEEYP